ncbi:fungal pheromone STE3G-protein-coupled receptor [Sistotremastrum suecicum HHB10207 ss-3]|uniref:Fungal pheromone STE3G-protein-coupled receptor n=1 Tax=Sistotremastrum suecicum HHB10207 ss-3 TaxID=1314776 RepID=A0A166CDR0_9AGAM|nr:fungal pheromone STE3G-protein-coupled receptor [Sistotremastrum suecicum HHB10207 ss-3]
MHTASTVYVPIALFCSLAVLIPLPWHLYSWNGGTCLIMIYTSLGLIIRSVDRIIWDDNVKDNMHIWCDITSRLLVMIGVGLPAAAFCLNRRLYILVSNPQSSMTGAQRQLSLYMDLLIGIGLPALVMGPIVYVGQASRYSLVDGYGCYPAMIVGPTWSLLTYAWPLVLGSGTVLYGGLIIRFLRRHSEAKPDGPGNTLEGNRDLTRGRFRRLSILAAVQSVGTLAPTAWIIYGDFHLDIRPLPEGNLHSTVMLWPYPEGLLRVHLEFKDWLLVIIAILFFAFFGFSEEARKQYKIFHRVLRRMLRLKIEPSQLGTELPAIEFAARYQDARDLEDPFPEIGEETMLR